MLEPRMENSGYEWWSQNWGHLPAATLHRTTPAWPSSGGEGADFGWNGCRVFEIEKNTSQQVGRAFFMNSFKRTRHFDEPQIWSLWKKKKKKAWRIFRHFLNSVKSPQGVWSSDRFPWRSPHAWTCKTLNEALYSARYWFILMRL